MRRLLCSPVWAVVAVALTVLLVAARDEKKAEPHYVFTRVGPLQFEGGYPSQVSVQKLYDEIDFQRACQAYLWAIPAVSINEWRHAHEDVFGAWNGQWILMTTLDEKFGILTPNNTTPYIVSTVDLARSGPFVVELPAGPIAGSVIDLWQRFLGELGAHDPVKKFEGEKYLILPPGYAQAIPEGYTPIRSPSNTVFLGLRMLRPVGEGEFDRLIRGVRSYPWTERLNPPAKQAVRPDNKKWSQVPPTGMKFWERVAEIVGNEKVEERDRFVVAQLKLLGIEKGKPFKPDDRQKKLLEDAAVLGDAMARANAFDKRVEPPFWKGTHWKDALVVTETQQTGETYQFDERAAWFFEAVTISPKMRSREVGMGMRYIAAYQDKNGDWLTGGKSYRLRVPANPPAEQFWSVTAYDQANRQFVVNANRSPDVSSRNELEKNRDDSYDIFLGPSPPKKKGCEKNWIQTNPGEGFFIYFRFFGPKKEFFDGSWSLPDLEPL